MTFGRISSSWRTGRLTRCRAALLCLIAAAICLPGTLPLPGQDLKPAVTEYQVKAAYLTKLGRFVENWSGRADQASDQSFDLCVLGRDPFGASLDAAIRGINIGGSPLEAKRITRAQDGLGCKVLFISSSEESQLTAIMAALGTAPVLTVADIPDFVKQGGMVQFVLDGNNVKFEINIAASRRAGLMLSSELLKVARVVRKTP